MSTPDRQSQHPATHSNTHRGIWGHLEGRPATPAEPLVLTWLYTGHLCLLFPAHHHVRTEDAWAPDAGPCL